MPIAAYRHFYDVPRAFLVELRPQYILFFDCPFDEAIDDYSACFEVFVIEGLCVCDLPTDWKDLYSLNNERLGSLPSTALRFNATRRREVFIDGLAELIRSSDRVHSVME
jgi:uncharacterized protein YjeT (DUF2065 family)